MKTLLLFLTLTTPALAAGDIPHTVEGSANSFVNDMYLEDGIARLEDTADHNANFTCTPQKAVRTGDYQIEKTRIDHGFRHGFMVTVTAPYNCVD